MLRQRTHPTPRHPRGLSLLEVIAALGVLVLLLLGLGSALRSGQALDTLGRERGLALQHAADALEQARALAWADLPAQDGRSFVVVGEVDGRAYPLAPGGGRSAPGLLVVETTPHPDLLHVRASVVFRSLATNDDVEVALTTFVARH